MGALWRPMTGKDIARLTGLTFEQVARRLPELQTRGEIRPTGVERDGCREWERDAAMTWIKMRNDLASDPAVLRLCRMTGMDRFAVIGRLTVTDKD